MEKLEIGYGTITLRPPIYTCTFCGLSLGIGNVFDSRVVIHNGVYMCVNCYQERITMPNIKITAEIDGKIVPLNTISTETFEAIKALEKPKEIPVARVARHYSDPLRLLIKPTRSIDLRIGKVYAIDLQCGALVAEWEVKNDEHAVAKTYTAVEPL